MSRLDVARFSRIIAERLAQFLDARRQRVVANDAVAPHRGEQVMFGYRFAGARDKHRENRRSLRRELDFALTGPESLRQRLESKTIEGDLIVHYGLFAEST